MFLVRWLFTQASTQSYPEKTMSMRQLSYPHQVVLPLITDREQVYSPQLARDALLTHVALDIPERYRQCLVTSIEWYRHNQKAHEILVIHFGRTTSDGRSVDKRVVRIERCKNRPAKDDLPSAQDSRDSFGLDNGNADSIRILETAAQANKSYGLVASFEVGPAAPLDIASCIVAAGSVTDYASNYSTLAHMCMWYVEVLFNIFRQMCGVPESAVAVETSAVAKRAGTVGGVRLVHVKGGFLDRIGSIEPIVQMVATETQRDLEEVRKEIQQDCANFRPSTIVALLQLSRQDIGRFWVDVQTRLDDIEARNHAFRNGGRGELSAAAPLATH